MRSLTFLFLVSVAGACQSGSKTLLFGPLVVDADTTMREPLFHAVASLEGDWIASGPEGDAPTEFRVTSAGTVVREIMYAGRPYEMTNMYSLDGNALQMTHYCAAGNQPHMRATALAGDRLEFAPAGVSDLEAAGEAYMGQMTLVFIDDDHVEQHWKGFGADPHDTIITLRRANP